eukprot:6356435-Ditylum_brightwellii.AAC.2
MLEVVHFPGDLVIHHGADSLSQGLWPSPLLQSQPLSIGYPFRSVALTELLLTWLWAHLVTMLGATLPPIASCLCMEDTSDWSPDLFLHQTSIWVSSPWLAWQALSYLASAW